MDNQIDVSNPLASAPVPVQALESSGSTALQSPVQSPLAPGTTPASLSATATPENTEGQPQWVKNPTQLENKQPAPPAATKAPGLFAAKLLQAIGGVLSAAQSAGQVAMAPDHMAELARQQNVARQQAQYKQEQAEKAQARQDAQTNEQRIQQREDDEAHARIALANVQTKALKETAYRQGNEALDKEIERDTNDYKSMSGQGGAEGLVQPVASGITGEQKMQLLNSGKIDAYQYTSFATGKKQTGVDENGDPTYDLTYDVVKVPDSWIPTDDQIARIKTVPGYTNYTKGTVLPGSQVLQLLRTSDLIKATNDSVNSAREKAGIDALDEKQRADLADFNKQGDFQNYMNTYTSGGNVNMVAAASHMLNDSAMKKKYGPALYNDVMSQFASKSDPVGTENFEKMRHDMADEQEKANADALKKAQDDTYEGDPTLTGEAFLNSVPDKKQVALIRQAGDGRMNASNLAALMRGKSGPSFSQAVAQYAPDFRADQVPAYYKAVTDYNDDKPGSVGGTIKAGAVAIQGLRDLYDNTSLESLNPASKDYAKYKTAVDTVANEVAKYNAGGRQPGTEDIEDIKNDLRGKILGVPGVNRKAAIKEQMKLVQKKTNEYEDDWAQKAPSPRYESPMPNMSNAARIDAAYVLNDGKYTVPRGAESFTDPKTNHQIYTFDGGQWYDASNGQPIKPTTPGAK